MSRVLDLRSPLKSIVSLCALVLSPAILTEKKSAHGGPATLLILP